MKETYNELTAIAAGLDEKLPGFFSYLRTERDAFERDYDAFMWEHYPKIELSFDFDTLYWMSILQECLRFDRYGNKHSLHESSDQKGENKLVSCLERADTFFDFFSLYYAQEHKSPFEQTPTPAAYTVKQPCFADLLGPYNADAAEYDWPILEGNTDHLLLKYMSSCEKSIHGLEYALFGCTRIASCALKYAGTKGAPDLAHRKQIVADWFSQSLHILRENACLTGDGAVSFDELMQQLGKEAETRTEEESEAIFYEMQSGWPHRKEYIRSKHDLDDHSLSKCQSALGGIATNLFSGMGLLLAYYHVRFEQTEENLKELLVRILVSRRLSSEGRSIDLAFDENHAAYSWAKSPIDVVKEKSGYNEYRQLSVEELIDTLWRATEQMEQAIDMKMDTVIRSIQDQLIAYPEETLDFIFQGGKQRLLSLNKYDIKLQPAFRHKGLKDWWDIAAISPYAEDILESMPMPRPFIDWSGWDDDQADIWMAGTQKGLMDLADGRIQDMPAGEDWVFECIDAYAKRCSLGIDAKTSFGSILRFPSPKENFEEGYVWHMVEDCHHGVLAYSGVPVQLKDNQSLRILRDSLLEHIVEDEKDLLRHPLGRFPSDTDFTPLLPIARHSQFYAFLLKRLILALEQLWKLEPMFEELSWVNHLIDLGKFQSLEKTRSLDVYIGRLRKRLYGAYHEKMKAKEYSELDRSFEQNEIWALYTDALLLMLEHFTIDKLPLVVDYKNQALRTFMCKVDSKQMYGYAERLMDTIDEKIRERVRETEYSFPESDPINELIRCKDRIIALYGEDGHFSKGDQQISFDEMIENARAFLKAGELLYLRFVADPKAEKLSDYGCVAIEYYKALEYLANQLLYRPYYYSVLQDRQPIYEDAELGYCGRSFARITDTYQSERKYKDALEYGTLTYFLSSLTSQRRRYTENSEDTMSRVERFFTDRGFDHNRIGTFAFKMDKTSQERNDCAHPIENGKGFAVKARVSVYNRQYGRDDIPISATEVVELIRELGKLFG